MELELESVYSITTFIGSSLIAEFYLFIFRRRLLFVLARGNLRSAGGEYHREYSMVFLCSPKPGKF